MKKTIIRIVSAIECVHVTKDEVPQLTITHWEGEKSRDEAIAEATEYAHELVAYYEGQGHKVLFKN